MLRLATQVQARTQQPTALGGQSRQLLVRTHAEESSRRARRNARSRYGKPLLVSDLRPEPAPGVRGWKHMAQATFSVNSGCKAGLLAVALTVALTGAFAATAQPAVSESAFQIVWVVIGEASSATDKGSTHAGRQLFMASDLMSKNLANVKVEQVEVTPVISELVIGEKLCLTAMNIRTLGPNRQPIEAAPLSIAVRQDHKQRLGLNRTQRDICVLPNAAGEYPMRLTSLLPARDGTMRGAQVFIRVSDPQAQGSTAADIPYE